MGSTRFPGKVLMDLNGIPMLQFQLKRVEKSRLVDQIIVATSTLEQDDQIATYCQNNEISCFRGSENDVLNRYYIAAKKYQAETIVRLIADCPLIDPVVIDRTIALFQESNSDYVANTAPPETSNFPDGSDVEVFSFQALEQAHQEATDEDDREHVTFYFWKSNKKNSFQTVQLNNQEDWSEFRFTVDYPEDFEVVKMIDAELKTRDEFGSLEEIIGVLRDHPEITALNSKYFFGIGWE